MVGCRIRVFGLRNGTHWAKDGEAFGVVDGETGDAGDFTAIEDTRCEE